MGTVVGIDVWQSDRDPTAAVDEAVAFLHDVDARFSPFKPDSEISRLASGQIDLEACSTDVRWVIGLCDDLERTTGGFFDARRHRLDGRLDPSGVVKGWSVDEAGLILERGGATSYVINAGGDILIRARHAERGEPWRVGIRDPRTRDRAAAILEIRDGAIATSGSYERGDHVRDPHTRRSPGELLSITVVGPSLTFADAYATAALAMGRDGVAFVADRPGYGAYAITADGVATWTAAIEPLLVDQRDRGIRTRKQVPVSAPRRTVIDPPSRRTSRSTIARPRPLPGGASASARTL
jgi:thiamine biosynthesis lipoprotein